MDYKVGDKVRRKDGAGRFGNVNPGDVRTVTATGVSYSGNQILRLSGSRDSDVWFGGYNFELAEEVSKKYMVIREGTMIDSYEEALDIAADRVSPTSPKHLIVEVTPIKAVLYKPPIPQYEVVDV